MAWRIIILVAIFVFATAALSGVYPVETWAAVTQPSMIPQKEVCSNGKVDSRRYLAWVYDNFAVARKCVDQNGDGEETLSERKSLLSNLEVDRRLCSGVFEAQGLTGELISQTSKKFAPRTPAPDTAENRRRFLEGHLTVSCIPQEAADDDARDGNATPKTKTVASQFKLRIRSNQQDLQYDQGTLTFSKAGGAKLSIAHDSLAGQTEYYAKGVVGIDTGEIYIGDNTLRVMPYLTGERKFTSNKNTQGDIDKAGVGAIAYFYYSPLSSPLHFTASVDPQFLTDSVGNTRIWGGNFRLEPAIILPNSTTTFPGGPRQAGPIYYDLDLNFLARYSHVVSNGGNLQLSGSKNYTYGGPEVRLDLFGVPGSMVDRFTLSLAYYYLYRFTGQLDRIEMFAAGLKYTLDDAGLFQWSIGYEDGRDIEQFVRRKGWMTALSYKF